jgi:hypothetical protein
MQPSNHDIGPFDDAAVWGPFDWSPLSGEVYNAVSPKSTASKHY